ncbi:MAG: hypothetical protein IJD48_03105, partial [Clostridia bacterium]|nr:hypothetical protein [Clostridia bacterium]
MYSFFKYKFIEELQTRHKNSFKMCTKNNIEILPPILKRIGVVYHLAFLVVEIDPNDNKKNIKRPIGVITLNKNGRGKEKIYDMSKYEFCFDQINYKKEYYSLVDSPSFWPNKNEKNIEFLKMCLQDLLKISNECNLLKKPNKIEYDNYLSRISKLFPANYWIFFEALQKNSFQELDEEDLNNRKKEEELYKKQQKENKIKIAELSQKKQMLFYNSLTYDLSKFCKDELVPNLQGKGSYCKLQFYYLFGNLLRKIKPNLTEYLNCYNPELPQSELDKNYATSLDKLKVKLIKNYSKAIDNTICKNIAVDTLSKVLIIYLNALLLEDMHKQLIKV